MGQKLLDLNSSPTATSGNESSFQCVNQKEFAVERLCEANLQL
jgi:hypothetical protein